MKATILLRKEKNIRQMMTDGVLHGGCTQITSHRSTLLHYNTGIRSFQTNPLSKRSTMNILVTTHSQIN